MGIDSRLWSTGNIVHELPQRGPINAFWRIFKATKRSFLHLYAEVYFCLGGGQGRGLELALCDRPCHHILLVICSITSSCCTISSTSRLCITMALQTVLFRCGSKVGGGQLHWKWCNIETLLLQLTNRK